MTSQEIALSSYVRIIGYVILALIVIAVAYGVWSYIK